MLHKFERNGVILALDTESGAVHILTPLASGIIDLFAGQGENVDSIAPSYAGMAYRTDCRDKCLPVLISFALTHGYEEQDVLEAYEELCVLFQDGMLYSEPVLPLSSDNASPSKQVPFAPGKAMPPVKALCLSIAHDCNMRCKYCFASTGDYGRDRSVMSSQTGKKAIDFVLSQSGSVHNLEVDFFGGEPLLAFDTVRDVVCYAREQEKRTGKCFRFTLTTNGTLLNDEIIDFINREMANVVLSVDGRKQVNDRVRYFEDGTGCYDAVLPKFQKLVSQRGDKDYYVRGTFTRLNLDFTEDVLHLADQGFDQISVEPVVTKDPALSLELEHLEQIEREYDRLADAIVQRRKDGCWFNFFHFMADLDEGPCVYKRTKGCGSGTEYLAVTPSGDIYPCHQFVEHEQFKLGNVYDQSLDLQKRQYFQACSLASNSLKACAGCWDKYFCGGGCAANNFNFNRDIATPYELGCRLQKKRTECTLYIKAWEALTRKQELQPC